MLTSPFNVVFVLMMFFGGEINVNEYVVFRACNEKGHI